MSLAIPGSRGCFSFLEHALRPGARHIKITKQVHHQLQEFLWLAKDISSRPTHLAEVVPTPPSYYGAIDAAKSAAPNDIAWRRGLEAAISSTCAIPAALSMITSKLIGFVRPFAVSIDVTSASTA